MVCGRKISELLRLILGRVHVLKAVLQRWSSTEAEGNFCYSRFRGLPPPRLSATEELCSWVSFVALEESLL